MAIRNEQGKVLTREEAHALVQSGEYMPVKGIDKNNQPYILIKKHHVTLTKQRVHITPIHP